MFSEHSKNTKKKEYSNWGCKLVGLRKLEVHLTIMKWELIEYPSLVNQSWTQYYNILMDNYNISSSKTAVQVVFIFTHVFFSFFSF